jgi:hypothetical protein
MSKPINSAGMQKALDATLEAFNAAIRAQGLDAAEANTVMMKCVAFTVASSARGGCEAGLLEAFVTGVRQMLPIAVQHVAQHRRLAGAEPAGRA